MEQNIIINIDSTYRDKTIYKNSGKFTINLPTTYRNVGSIRLASVEFPNLFYTFSKLKNNTYFYISTITMAPYKIEIKEGNYVASNFISELNSKFSELATLSGLTITAALDIVSGKVTFSSNSIFNLSFPSEFKFTLGNNLGFINKEYLDNKNYTGEGILDVIGDSYVFIRINDYGDLVTQFGDKNILGKIVLTQSKAIMVFDNSSNYLTKSYIFKTPQNISKLNIELLDRFGNNIDMLNLDYSFTLELQTIFDNTKSGIYYDTIKNDFDFKFKNKY
jgi:hypothetical protein